MTKEEIKEIDCFCTTEIICPYCGHEHSNSWEFLTDGDLKGFACDNCDKEFCIEVEHETTYTSSKKESND